MLANLTKLRYVLPLILAGGIAVLICLNDRDPIHRIESHERLEHNFYEYLDGVTNQTYPGPYVYRILVPTTLSFLHRMVPVLSPLNIDFVVKFLLLVLCQALFFAYQRLFFDPTKSFLGVALLDVLIGFALVQLEGPTLIETMDILNVTVFLLAFMTIYLDYFKWFCIILFIGTLNRETTFLLPIIFLIVNGINRKSVYKTLVAFVAVGLPYVALHILIHPAVTDWIRFDAIAHNIPFIGQFGNPKILLANIHLLVLLGPLTLLALYDFSKHSKFLKSVSYIAPLFVLIHYVVGVIMEARLWMPLFIILIPLAIDTIARLYPNAPDYESIRT